MRRRSSSCSSTGPSTSRAVRRRIRAAFERQSTICSAVGALGDALQRHETEWIRRQSSHVRRIDHQLDRESIFGLQLGERVNILRDDRQAR